MSILNEKKEENSELKNKIKKQKLALESVKKTKCEDSVILFFTFTLLVVYQLVAYYQEFFNHSKEKV
jgi:hypothetical protein